MVPSNQGCHIYIIISTKEHPGEVKKTKKQCFGQDLPSSTHATIAICISSTTIAINTFMLSSYPSSHSLLLTPQTSHNSHSNFKLKSLTTTYVLPNVSYIGWILDISYRQLEFGKYYYWRFFAVRSREMEIRITAQARDSITSKL